MLSMAGKIGNVLCCGNCQSRRDEGGGGGGGLVDLGGSRRSNKTREGENTENKSSTSFGSMLRAKGIDTLYCFYKNV